MPAAAAPGDPARLEGQGWARSRGRDRSAATLGHIFGGFVPASAVWGASMWPFSRELGPSRPRLGPETVPLRAQVRSDIEETGGLLWRITQKGFRPRQNERKIS